MRIITIIVLPAILALVICFKATGDV